MSAPRCDGFFPSGAYPSVKSDGRTVYRLDFPDGWGAMTAYAVLPGITLIFNDFHTRHDFPEERRCPGLIEINHCRNGHFECEMADGRVVWLGPQDFSVSDMGRPPRRSSFSQGSYEGVSLVVEPARAEPQIRRILGEEMPPLQPLFADLLRASPFLLLRAEPQIQHIFGELYDAPPESRGAYFRLKAAELMLFLCERKKHVSGATSRYCSRDMALRVRELERRMTQDLHARVPLSRLAAECGLSPSTLKKYFPLLYGEPPYAYLKRRRMETAAAMLQSGDLPVTTVGQALGYQNASKFSAAFRDIYGISPRDYKKGILLE